MEIQTHKLISQEFCGTPLVVEKGYSKVELKTSDKMIVDETGLIHGGFLFGLADYAAMIAVNHPNVVLGGAQVKFIKPVKNNKTILAEAVVENSEGKKQNVNVTISAGKETVFQGMFTCFVLEKHVLK
ncbi:MAG: thioesterase [Desulfobacterium sp.]|nr:thioesterase [Desulfobacterium sp.]